MSAVGLETHAQLPAVDLKSTPFNHSGKLTCGFNMYVGISNTSIDFWLDVAGLAGFIGRSWLAGEM